MKNVIMGQYKCHLCAAAATAAFIGGTTRGLGGRDPVLAAFVRAAPSLGGTPVEPRTGGATGRVFTDALVRTGDGLGMRSFTRSSALACLKVLTPWTPVKAAVKKAKYMHKIVYTQTVSVDRKKAKMANKMLLIIVCFFTLDQCFPATSQHADRQHAVRRERFQFCDIFLLNSGINHWMIQ